MDGNISGKSIKKCKGDHQDMDNIETVTAPVVRPREPQAQGQPHRISNRNTQLAWNLFAAFNLLACAALAMICCV